jgi:hypothetical protein
MPRARAARTPRSLTRPGRESWVTVRAAWVDGKAVVRIGFMMPSLEARHLGRLRADNVTAFRLSGDGLPRAAPMHRIASQKALAFNML